MEPEEWNTGRWKMGRKGRVEAGPPFHSPSSFSILRFQSSTRHRLQHHQREVVLNGPVCCKLQNLLLHQ